MKKFLVAMMALCAMAVSFTSCNQNNPSEPISGKSYRYDQVDPAGYVIFTFHNDHSATIDVSLNGQQSKSSAFKWAMTSATEFNVKLEEMVTYKGVYKAEEKAVYMTIQGVETPQTMICKEVTLK